MKKFLKINLIMVIILASLATVTFAAWWGTPGYEWCFSKGITSIMTQKEMNQKVTQADFYAIILRYLRLKGVEPGRTPIQTAGDTSNMNSAILGMMNYINDYLIKNELTTAEFRQVITYIEHAKVLVKQQEKLLSKNDIKSFNLYLSLASYKASTLINNSAYRSEQVAKYGNVKFAGIFEYGLNPYYGDITRKEFLVLMFSLLSDQNLNEEQIIELYNESGVLVGYNNDLMLNNEITYSEIFTFLYRFEAFEFNDLEDEE